MKTENKIGWRRLGATLIAPFALLAATMAMVLLPATAMGSNARGETSARPDESRETHRLVVRVSDRKGRSVARTDMMVGVVGVGGEDGEGGEGGEEQLLPLDDNGSRVLDLNDDASIVLATKTRLYNLPVEGVDSLHVVFHSPKRLEFVLSENGVDREVDQQFATISNRFRTAAMNSLDADDNATSFIDLKSYIQGRIGGVMVQNDQLFVRGNRSVQNSGEALVVVDGAIMSNFKQANDSVRPVDIANVTVLKDSNASIYGAQGVNGVLVITTKTRN